MALFSRTKKAASKESVSKKEVSVASVSNVGDLSHVLKHARITEKATMHVESGVYTFEIADSATKNQVAQAVSALYKVRPRMVRVVRIPTKIRRNARTGKMGVKQGGKKAYVYLKKGETLTIS